MGGPAIAVTGLGKGFGTKEAVAGIDLEVAVGSLVGPNGAGKGSRARPTAGVLAVIALGAALAACGTSEPAAAPGSAPSAPGAVLRGSWPYPNGDLANTRVAPDSTISSANVSQLRQAWTFTAGGLHRTLTGRR